MALPPILGFDDPDCENPNEAGGKGSGLARMTRLGLPVPAGFVIRASVLADLLDSSGVRERVLALLADAGSDSGAAESARAVQPLIRGLKLPADLSGAVVEAFQRLHAEAGVAVRSSACAEDSEAASFAGQQETYLNVRGTEEVLDKVKDCWMSFFSERALFYRSRKGSLVDLGMAVVVQRQLSPDRSGVMFTVDPVRRRRDQMMIEAVWGLGEAVVSGHATPDHYVVSREGAVKQARVSVQEFAVRADVSGGVREYVLTAEEGGARVLDDSDLAALAKIGRQLEADFGQPLDVEWAFEGGNLYLLQSRPVTA
ncbi:MAG: phosphoenolpyruvate synthase [Candidatus Dormibacteraeota bacterium]|nr:phosphoenolpyruvate synthase [Candidatus Dormibacteraeota bacterium]